MLSGVRADDLQATRPGASTACASEATGLTKIPGLRGGVTIHTPVGDSLTSSYSWSLAGFVCERGCSENVITLVELLDCGLVEVFAARVTAGTGMLVSWCSNAAD